MKMKRNLIILGAVLLVVVAGVVFATNYQPPAEPTATPAPTEDPALLLMSNYTSDQVKEVTIKNNITAPYTVLKSGDKYVVQGMESSDFNQTTISSLVYNAAYVAGDRMIEQNPKDLSVYGLDKPQATVTAKYVDGKTNVFLIGDMSPAGNSYYIMLEGGDKVYTVWMNVGGSFLKTPDSMLNIPKIQLTQEEIETVTVLKNGEPMLEVTNQTNEKDVALSPWRIVKPWKRSVDAEVLSKYLQTILEIEMNSVEVGDAKDLAQYGLDKPEYELTVSGAGKTDQLLFGKKKDDYNTYVKFANSNTVYTMSTSLLDFTKTTPYKLMDKMILLVNITSAVGVEFDGLGVNGKMDIEHKVVLDSNGKEKLDGNGKKTYDQVFTISGKPVDDKVARYFYQTCIGLQTHSMVKEGWVPTGTPLAVLTYTRNADPREIKIEFMAYDDDFFAVRMDGGTHFLIKKEKVQKVADDLKLLKEGKLTVPAN